MDHQCIGSLWPTQTQSIHDILPGRLSCHFSKLQYSIIAYHLPLPDFVPVSLHSLVAATLAWSGLPSSCQLILLPVIHLVSVESLPSVQSAPVTQSRYETVEVSDAEYASKPQADVVFCLYLSHDHNKPRFSSQQNRVSNDIQYSLMPTNAKMLQNCVELIALFSLG